MIFTFELLFIIWIPTTVIAQDTIQPQSIHQLQYIEHNGETAITEPVEVLPGIEVLFNEHIDELSGKNIGVVVNHTAVDKEGTHLVDRLIDHDVLVEAIFAPEHGYRGEAAAGEHITGGIDPVSGAVVYSLYGEALRPTTEMLEDIDILIYDIQDVGVRFYTYITTLGYTMEAAAREGVEYWVLDRPNPIRGNTVSGPTLQEGFESFVGRYPIPVQYGMTAGELAQMIVGEGWLDFPETFQPRVISMEGWQRNLWYNETDIPLVAPSPNMPTVETATVYPGMCFIEGINVSEGRGTPNPFLWIGAPYIEELELSQQLNNLQIPGVVFEPITFTPQEIPGVAYSPKYQETLCRGVQLVVTDRDNYEAVKTGVYVIWLIHELYPEDFQWIETSIDRLYGSDQFRKMIDNGASAENIIDTWEEVLEQFKKHREAYLLF